MAGHAPGDDAGVDVDDLGAPVRRPPAFLSLLCTGAVALAALTVPASPAAAATLPAGFSESLVANVPSPTAVAFAPGGRILVASQGGQLRLIEGGVLATTPALDLSARICRNSERGLLGVAVDPDAASRSIYLFWTARGSDATCPTSSGANPAGAPRNRVSRFTLGADGRVDPASEVVLLDGIHSSAGNHNAGHLAFGKDGFLYVSTGDGGCDYKGDSGCAGANDAAEDVNILGAKVLRITRTGAIPAGNPFTGPGTARCATGPAPAGVACQETFARGLRNPFRLAFDPNASGTRFYINDVGQNAWEEIDEGIAGADYGWNEREGHCANTGSVTNCGGPKPARFTDPVHDYPHAGGCASITGGAFVPRGIWPAAYDGAYLYSDYVCSKVFSLRPSGEVSDFATAIGSSGAVDLAFGPHGAGQALYYTTYASGGQLRRITYTGAGNRTPQAQLAVSPASGPSPLAATLDGSGSSDPDGDALTYLWSFGDGTADRSTSTATTSHTYAAGTWTATLRVRDPSGATSAPVTFRVVAGNAPPTVRITSPAAGALFSTGQEWVLRGTATDPEDGALPDSALSWTVIRRHDSHTHPFLGPVTGNGIPFTAPGPEDLQAAANSGLEIVLTATDSRGASTTVRQAFDPRKVPVTIDTAPRGRQVVVNGVGVTGPATLVSWAGFPLQLTVAQQADATGRTYALDRWSDGSTAVSRTMVTSASATTLTAELSLRGLMATYYDTTLFGGAQVHRLDPRIDFVWASDGPAPGAGPGGTDAIGTDTFSARWTGSVVAPVTQTWTFTAKVDDGVRLWVDGRLLIDSGRVPAAPAYSASIPLQAGVPYPIVVEYYEQTGYAAARLEWSSPSQPRQVVPTSALRPALSVDFAPAAAGRWPGQVVDTGAVFGARAGLAHGWDEDTTTATRNRDSSRAPDQRYDTLILTQAAPNTDARWELALAPGTYRLRTVAGDPVDVDSHYRFAAEDSVILDGVPTLERPYVVSTRSVTVTDGRLTLTNASGSRNGKLAFVQVTLE